jgi:hypothetical protein
MTNVRDPIKRSEMCLSCHLGTATKWVDHEMIAAGHPDLYFELDSFTAAMPKHWKETDKDPWVDVRMLATGEAVQLRENLRRIVRDTNRGWPEYSELDCFACHHTLAGAANNWRQERGYSGRKPGSPTWNASRWSVLKVIAEQVTGDDARRLDKELTRVSALISDVTADRRQIGAAAQSASELADQIAKRMASFSFDEKSAVQLIGSISGNAEWIASHGQRSAEQAAMVLNSLVLAYCANAKPASASQAKMKSGVKALFQLVDNPSAYNPSTFAGELRAFHGLFR